mgnify:CR=1 FL=1
MSVTIKKVSSSSELKKFIRFNYELYKENPFSVPDLYDDMLNTFSREKNAAFEFCDADYFLAYKDGKLVGRVAAILNKRANETWGKKEVRFGWVDFVNDMEVSDALFKAVEAWGKERGMTSMVGPLGFTDFDAEGMLVEGFEQLSTMATIYNFPYYPQHMEKLGFEKECDWIQYRMPADQGVDEKMEAIAERMMGRYKVHKADFDKLKKDPESIAKFFKAYNESFDGIVYNFVPFTEEEIAEEVKQIMGQLDSRLCCVLMDEDDEVAAFGISTACVSRAMQKAKGRLFPFGWYHVLKAPNDFEHVDLMIQGAAPKWQNTGISAVFHSMMARQYKDCGAKWALANPQIETNTAVNVWARYEHELWMRRRCWIKRIR